MNTKELKIYSLSLKIEASKLLKLSGKTLITEDNKIDIKSCIDNIRYLSSIIEQKGSEPDKK